MAGTPTVVLITGASSGFGKACADYLAQRGYRVFGTSRRPAPAGLPFTMLPMDVCDDASVQRGVQAVLEQAGRIDVVVNNAGMGIAGSVEDTSIEEARIQMETNFMGTFRVCQAVLSTMRAQRAGKIINISSIAGQVGIPYQALYSASKYAVEGLSEALRLEVKPWGVRVVLVEPGDAHTAFTDHRSRAAASAQNPDYAKALDNALGVMERDERNGFSPVRLAQAVERIIRTPNPRLRYVVAPLPEAAAIALKRWLPWAVFEWAIPLYYRCGRKECGL